MLTPFQRLLYCSQQSSTHLNVLLAASGPSIRVFAAEDGTFISKWSHVETPEGEKNPRDRSPGSHDAKEPPLKKKKLSGGDDAASDTSVEVVVEDGSKRRRKPKRKPFSIPSVVLLIATTDGKYIVAVTGEDKTIRVLELLGNGTLKQLSQRYKGTAQHPRASN